MTDHKEILKTYNAWRRDETGGKTLEDFGITPKMVGEAIDAVLEEVEDLREEVGGISEVSSEFAKALKRLTLNARTSGGTAGPDKGLMDACQEAEHILSLGGIGRAYMIGADSSSNSGPDND